MDEPQRPLALLRHDVPEHGSHFDLLLATTVGTHADERSALAWRTLVRVEAMVLGGRAAIAPIGAHRALYLALTEPRELGGDRGRVAPAASGRWAPLPDGRAALVWSPHRPPMIVTFRDRRGPIDARDDAALAMAIEIERLREER